MGTMASGTVLQSLPVAPLLQRAPRRRSAEIGRRWASESYGLYCWTASIAIAISTSSPIWPICSKGALKATPKS